jgi:SpoVK/Ycf46/Vps4 family AAA+-type ATPase
MHGDLVFGWRLKMKLQLLDAQVRLLAGVPEEALRIADDLREDAVRAGVPRYDASARLVVHRARAALGEPVDLDEAWRNLGDVERAVRVEAWWWAGQTGAELGQQRWLDRAERLADDLARAAGPRADGLRADADRHLVRWRALSAR